MTQPLTGAAVDPAAYAIAGTVPRQAVRPASPEEAAEALRAATRDRLTVVPWGAGLGLARTRPPARYDVALDLTALDQVIEHNPDDLTLTARCGATLATLATLLAAHGQELPLEGGGAGRATLGGVLAANASGPRRMRFGSPRDRILGARFALTDGTMARSGGKVVKNVAGYGIHRLLCGSRGGLAVILEASLKLAPAPGHRAALIFDVDAATIADRSRWALLVTLEPAAATVLSAGVAAASRIAGVAAGRFAVVIGLEDDRLRVAEQESALTRTLGTPAARVAPDEVPALWRRIADLELRDGARAFTGRGITPVALTGVTGELVFHAPAGRLLRFADGDGYIAPQGFAAIEGSPAARATPAGVAALRARIRTALDPAETLALGAGWIAGD